MTALAGRKVALTGSMAGTTREAIKQRIVDAGGAYSATLDADVNLLVTGDDALASRIDKARSLGVQVLDQAAFEALLAGQSPLGAAEDEAPVAAPLLEDAPDAIATLRDGNLRVLDVAVTTTSPGPLTPPMSLFSHYTLDRLTLAMLRFVARAVRLRQPCLLEGDTATSKTSAVLYLAALTGHQVVRLNLNGQTDTSELIGRYVPNDALPIDQADLLAHLDLLEDESQRILTRADAEHRPLTGVEAQQVAANERIERPQWRWQEGLVPQAMRHGWWLILDEVNLAEPQVLERLNAVMEREPSLVLTEGPGTRYGIGGDIPVHANFRVFGTMNPAEYQGRSVLSPAWKDRWVAHYHADSPGELELRHMLNRVVFGRQPDVEVNGLLWAGAEAEAGPYAHLADAPHIGDLLARLAAFHAGLMRMVTAVDGKAPALGASRRERYVVSRRGLLAVLDALVDGVLCDPLTGRTVDFAAAPEPVALDAIHRVYLDRLRGDDDRNKVVQLLRSLGLWHGSWLVGAESA